MNLPQTLDVGDGIQIPLLDALQATRHVITATSLIQQEPRLSALALEIAQDNLTHFLGGPDWEETAFQLIEHITTTEASK
ncbi:hypothetical protein [Synechococcus sp. ROS8604]|uniref:hypothetical protein n=1 Tax=Synechococcus sp. ROS8604 TaxID=1442557 RepID=UPI0016487F1A|nr:hypothetical protein [Synechococcus sp. ROS8604]QNI89554.1 hypothetical protein SynROS8604_02938 [Synechococcus sp. ROS8604]